MEALGLLKKSKDGKVSVNYFEQGTGGRLRRLQGEDEFGQSLMDPDGEAENRLKQLEEELEQATQFTKIVEDMWGKEGAEKLRKRVALQDTHRDESLIKPTVLLPNEAWPRPQDRLHIFQLNNMIRTIGWKVNYGSVNAKRINGLWKYYFAARKALSKKWELVHADIWDLLWQILAADSEHNPNRMSHVHILAKDMEEAGVVLRYDQQLLAIESIFVSVSKEEAITAHRKLVTTLGADPEAFVDFWQLGLRMYCLIGELARAERIANILIDSPYDKDPRFLLPLIRLCTENPATVEKGFELYQRLRSALGDSITINDYDLVISYFLTSNETEYAFNIFVEMMTSNTVNVHGSFKIPASVASPFFYGKWLKRLIAAGDLRGAYDVLLYMKSRGVRPQAIVVNGLIGAWLRTGMAENIRKAEEVAWAMINSRLQFIVIRKDMHSLANWVRLRPFGEGWPTANLETFSLLAENYKDRGMHNKMEELWGAIREAEIDPDSFMLNQLIFSYLKDGQGKLVASISRDLIAKYQIEPDSWTFLALWQALPINRLVQIPPGQLPQEVLRTRSLFADLVKSAHIFTTTGLDVQVARYVLHSFRKLEDKFGLLLAYRALRHIFHFNPPDIVVLELHVGSMDLEKTGKGKNGHRLMHTGNQIEGHLRRRHGELIASGQISPEDDLPEEVKREELSNFLDTFLENQVYMFETEDTEQCLVQAAMEMGFHGGVPRFKATPEIGE